MKKNIKKGAGPPEEAPQQHLFRGELQRIRCHQRAWNCYHDDEEIIQHRFPSQTNEERGSGSANRHTISS